VASRSGELFTTGHDGSIFAYEGRLDADTFDRLLTWASKIGASDVTLQSNEPVWAEIGGDWMRVTARRVSHPEVEGVVRGIYGENGPAELLSGNDIDPSHEVKTPYSHWRLRYRVNITAGRIPGAVGFQLTIRTMPSQPPEIVKLGIEPDIIANLRPELGLNLVTGPTGSGKSTLLASIIRYLCEREDACEKVLEYSKPIEYVYDGLTFPNSFVFQSEIGTHLRPRQEDDEGSLWEYGVRNSLRRKPGIIVIGECRDRATMAACIDAAQTGHLAMSTAHTVGVPETIRRILRFFEADEQRSVAIDLLEVLNLVVTQRLIDRVGGGKVGVREYILFDSKLKAELIALDPADWPARLRSLLRKRLVTGRSMADAARALRIEGTITANTYEWIAARTAGDSKVVRDAMGVSRLMDLAMREDRAASE
jgi:defect-in-organelle-trafficking protein DotB